jgi:transposase InsO family protein
MPWFEVTAMLQKKEFVRLARCEEANVSELCRRFRISRKTGYKWLGRESEGGEDWARDRSRRPNTSPMRTSDALEDAVLAVRAEREPWGGRKIRKRLGMLGHVGLPTASTITAILRRHGKISPLASAAHDPLRRFERSTPNELWQMDFKGAIATLAGACHPLTVVDDHSRYALCVAACANERAASVREALEIAFRRYGLPGRMLMDNGPCWGRIESRYSLLGKWLIRLGIAISHGRPYHPQTQGKNERFNRTLKAEGIGARTFGDLCDCQRAFDRFRHIYNHERPHDALGLETPASRYRLSPVPYPETLPPLEYLPDDTIRRVGPAGYVSYRKDRYQVGRAFTGEPVALRATDRDAVLAVYYGHHQVAVVDLREKTCKQV